MEDERVTVSLPDLTVSFLAQQPKVNKHYELASKASKEWVILECALDEKGKKIVAKGDFGYYVAVAVPHADMGRYRVFSDWGK